MPGERPKKWQKDKKKKKYTTVSVGGDVINTRENTQTDVKY